MSTTKRRTPLSMAIVVGVGVFLAMMAGVGGYQANAAHMVGAFMLGADEPVSHAPAIHPVGSALSMCAWPADSDGNGSSPSISIAPTTSRGSTGTASTHSPPGLVGACN